MFRTQTHRRLGVLVALLVCAGCGPSSTLQVSVKNVQQDVKFGAPTQPPVAVIAPPPAADLEPGSPPFLGGPIPYLPSGPRQPVLPTATPRPALCPDPLPGAPLAATVTPDTEKAPAPGVYSYRQVGAWTAGSAQGQLPALVTREVGQSYAPQQSAVAPPPPGSPATPTVEWNVSEQNIDANGYGTQTVTTYGLFPGSNPNNPTAPPSMQYGSIGIVEVHTTYMSGPKFGTADDFLPSTPIILIKFPATADGSDFWSSNAVDRNAASSNGRRMEIAAQISKPSATDPYEGKVQVNVCGHQVEAWRVELIVKTTVQGQDTGYQSGVYESPNQPCYLLGGYYDVATELGLVVQEHMLVTGGVSTAQSCNTSPVAFSSDRLTTLNALTPT